MAQRGENSFGIVRAKTIRVVEQTEQLGLDWGNSLGPIEYPDFVKAAMPIATTTHPGAHSIAFETFRQNAILAKPNFAHWRCRTQVFFKSNAPVTKQLSFNRNDTPNVHCLSLKDFGRFCKRLGVKIEKKIPLINKHLSPVRLASKSVC